MRIPVQVYWRPNGRERTQGNCLCPCISIVLRESVHERARAHEGEREREKALERQDNYTCARQNVFTYYRMRSLTKLERENNYTCPCMRIVVLE